VNVESMAVSLSNTV